jgi:hypothetical protein
MQRSIVLLASNELTKADLAEGIKECVFGSPELRLIERDEGLEVRDLKAETYVLVSRDKWSEFGLAASESYPEIDAAEAADLEGSAVVVFLSNDLPLMKMVVRTALSFYQKKWDKGFVDDDFGSLVPLSLFLERLSQDRGDWDLRIETTEP